MLRPSIEGGFSTFAMSSREVDDLLNHLPTAVHMGHFAPLEHHRDLDFVAIGEKTARLLDLEIDVVLAGFRAQANLFHLHVVCLGAFGLLSLLFIFELAEIHNPANWRPLIGSDLDQIQPGLPGRLQRVDRSQDAKLFIVLPDHSHRGNAELFGDPLRRFDR